LPVSSKPGHSLGKLATLRLVADALAAGTLNETTLERSRSDAARLLRGIKGIGPWAAAVALLRGLGRLDMPGAARGSPV
jgi:DNA-3-methyladenine glycosylase II